MIKHEFQKKGLIIKLDFKKVGVVLLSILFALLTTQSYSQTTVGLIKHDDGVLAEGYVLFAPIGSKDTYLIDKCGREIHTWTSAYNPGQSSYLLEDGTLLRPGKINNNTFTGGGNGGIVEKFDWEGNVIWSYIISDEMKCQHHDVKGLPNGNVLVIAWESKTDTEAIEQGRDPALVPTTVWSEQILEIQPVGINGGNIVWEWHLWDHLVQDFDDSKTNYGDISSNPQLINLNYNASADGSDWIHMNSIDYNPTLDQILVSSHSFGEVWIIDHSTTTEQAASHSGGKSDKGGDILYRWGNPLAYNTGTSTQLFGQHNAHWIEEGLPFENQIMVFNNGTGRPEGNYSTIEIINPPVDGFNYSASLPYLPASASWIHNAENQFDLYAHNLSSAQQLSNGNVIYCNGPLGTFEEINASGVNVWEYVNPVSRNGNLSQGDTPIQNLVFRITYYANDYIGFTGHSLETGSIIEDNNSVASSCSIILAADDHNPSPEAIHIYPNPAREAIRVTSTTGGLQAIKMTNSVGQNVTDVTYPINTREVSIPVSQLSCGLYFLKISDGKNLMTYKVVIGE